MSPDRHLNKYFHEKLLPDGNSEKADVVVTVVAVVEQRLSAVALRKTLGFV